MHLKWLIESPAAQHLTNNVKLTEISQLLDDYNYCNITQSGLSNKDHSSELAKLKKARSIKNAKDLLKSYQGDEQIKKLLKKRIALQEQLLSFELWQCHPHQTALQALVNRFSVYSFRALEAAAYQYLPAIEAALIHLKQDYEAKKTKLTASERKAYNTYLSQGFRIIAKEKKALAEAYYQRLLVYAKTGNADVQAFVINALQNIDKEQLQTSDLPIIKPSITEFNKAVNYIQQHGKSIPIQKLKTLNWPASDQSALIIRDNRVLEIPKSLISYIPQTQGYAWERGKRQRYQIAFALDAIAKQAHLAFDSSVISFDLKQDTLSPQLQRLDDLQIAVAAQIKSLEAKQPRGLLANLFLRTSQQATKEAIHHLKNQQATIVEQQVQLAKTVIAKLDDLQHGVNMSSQTGYTQQLWANL